MGFFSGLASIAGGILGYKGQKKSTKANQKNLAQIQNMLLGQGFGGSALGIYGQDFPQAMAQLEKAGGLLDIGFQKQIGETERAQALVAGIGERDRRAAKEAFETAGLGGATAQAIGSGLAGSSLEQQYRNQAAGLYSRATQDIGQKQAGLQADIAGRLGQIKQARYGAKAGTQQALSDLLMQQTLAKGGLFSNLAGIQSNYQYQSSPVNLSGVGTALDDAWGWFNKPKGGGGGDLDLPGCWVAREVYGAANPRWILFREWLMSMAPGWFRRLYIRHGERFAAFISDKPRVKSLIRRWMDSRI